MNNENKKLSRSRKRGSERNIKMGDKMKSLLNKIKSEKKKKKKTVDKIKQLKIELVKIKYSNKPDKLQNVLKELSKIQVVSKNYFEIKNEKLGFYAGEF